MRRSPLSARRANGGFTLAEAAVTIAIVGIVLLAVMQGLQGAKMASLNVKNQKTAYELGTGLLGEIRWPMLAMVMGLRNYASTRV